MGSVQHSCRARVSEAYLRQPRDSHALKALFRIDLSPCSRCNAQHPAYLPNTQNL